MRRGTATYAEIGVTTNFSFLHGASHPQEYVHQASCLGLAAIGIADRNTLAGVVRAYGELDNPDLGCKPKLLIGARLVFRDGVPDILAYPQDRAAYGRLCRLLTRGKLAAEKGDCHLRLPDLLEAAEGLLLVLMPPFRFAAEDIDHTLVALRRSPAAGVWLALSFLYRGSDARRAARLRAVATAAGVPLIATNDVLYHDAARRPLQDVLTCIRDKTTIDAAGRTLEANAERHLKSPQEMARLYRNYPEALAETLRLAERIRFSLDALKYQYPDEPVPPGKTAQRHLEDLTWAGAHSRYPRRIPPQVKKLLRKELRLIRKLDYAHYFLTVHDVVAFARSKNILCQGRGSAANSAVCYVLGITAVNPAETQVLFERFISRERREPPDIDVDFEHERREEVMQYVFARYGRARAAIVATVIHYRPRSAIRDVGKALGLTEDVTARLADTVWGSRGHEIDAAQVRQAGLDPHNPMIGRAVALAGDLIGFPRHLSQHVGGFVLTQQRLDEYVPIGNAAMAERTFIEWDKDDIDTVRMMKVDVLALGMLTCIRKCLDLIETHKGERFELATIPREQEPVYKMLSRGESLGVFQVESRAQMNMLPRLKPKKFYDLVIEVAIVRPGPIQGDMVHPYLRRRNKLEKEDYPSPAPRHGPPDELKSVLGRTLGVPLFQEQAMQLAIVAAKFTPSEANQLRRSMATFRNRGDVGKFRERMVGNMVARGYPQEFAERCFKQIEGFGTYGFPESHAASFAQLVYASSWIKHYHPEAFACGLLNSQPMGFYAPAQIVRDARANGVEVRAIDVSFSHGDNTLEPADDGRFALRLGFRQIDGFKCADAVEDWGARIVAARARGSFASLEEFARATALPKRALVLLADADAFRSLGLDRRAALWAVRRLPDDVPLPLFAATAAREQREENAAALPSMPLAEHVVADYQSIRLSLKGHPMQFLRAMFLAEGVVDCAAVGRAADGAALRSAGVVLVRQQPGSAKGVVFMTLEDETGIVNVVVWRHVMARFRKEVMGARVVLVTGRIQKSPEGVVHLVAERLVDRSADLYRLSHDLRERAPFLPDETPSDNARGAPDTDAPQTPHVIRHPRNVRILPRSRDFH